MGVAGLARSGCSWIGQEWVWLDWPGVGVAGLARSGCGWIGQEWVQLDWPGVGVAGWPGVGVAELARSGCGWIGLECKVHWTGQAAAGLSIYNLTANLPHG